MHLTNAAETESQLKILVIILQIYHGESTYSYSLVERVFALLPFTLLHRDSIPWVGYRFHVISMLMLCDCCS